MSIGIDKRLDDVFSSGDNRSLCIACDHGLMTDPHKSWLNINQVVNGAIQAKADGILTSVGQICRFVAQYGKGNLPSFIIRTDWTNLLRLNDKPEDKNVLLPVNKFEYRRLISAYEVLYRYGGSASIGFLFIDPEGIVEALTTDSSRHLIEESHEIGLPCIIEVLPLTASSSKEFYDELLSRGIKKALSMGADAIKMPITDQVESFGSIIHDAGKRLFVLGGSNLSDEALFVTMMQRALECGVDGLLVGRNVSNSKDPVALIRKLRSVVHPNGDAL